MIPSQVLRADQVGRQVRAAYYLPRYLGSTLGNEHFCSSSNAPECDEACVVDEKVPE